VKIGATRDCIAPREKSEAAAPRLPPATEWRWIPGGNHAQFGSYGPQLGDCRASIPRQAQRHALVHIIEHMLDDVEDVR
jgi:hypothetical protein